MIHSACIVMLMQDLHEKESARVMEGAHDERT